VTAAAQIRECALFRIQAQFNLFIRRVWAMAGPAFVGQDLPNVAVEFYFARRIAILTTRTGCTRRRWRDENAGGYTGCDYDYELYAENESRSARHPILLH
jgi:hypothetical protein